MSSKTLATWANAASLAGVSNARQERQVATGLNIVTRDRYSFCNLLGGEEPYKANDGKIYTREIQGKIRSKSVKGLKPELYNFELAPNSFSLTAATAAVNNGDAVNLTLNSTAGINVNDTLLKSDQGVMLRVTSVTSSTVVATKVIIGATGAALSDDSNVARIIKMGSATSDGSTVGAGVNQEPINYFNYLQFHLTPVSIGMIQKQLSTYGGSGNNFADMKKIAAGNFQRDRESSFIFGKRATEGTAGSDSYITYSGGLIEMAGNVYDNDSADGTLTEDDFLRGLMPMMRQGGGGSEVWALSGTDVMTTIGGFHRNKMQTAGKDERYMANVRTYETPAGILHLVPSAMMDQPAFRGQMIGFQPELITRYYLEGMDSQFIENLGAQNVLKDTAAYACVEGLLCDNQETITLARNILK